MGQQSQSLPTPEAFEQLRLLAQRLLSPRFGSVGINPDLTLLPGELPPDLAGTLPLPPSTNIIGTMLVTFNTTKQPFPRATCIIDIPGERSSVFAHFATALPTSGWQAEEIPQMQPRQGGFSYNMPWQDQQVMYRHPSIGWLVIKVEGDNAGITHLQLELSPSSMFAQMRRAASRRSEHFSRLPTLPPLPGTTLIPGGASGGDRRLTSEATLTGPVTMANVQSFYRDRLDEAGWFPVEAAIETRTAWSIWTFVDEDKESWHGFLLIFQSNLDRPAWNLRIEATLDSDPFAGNGSYSSIVLGSH